MSVKDGMHKVIRCRCNRCGAFHDDLVTAAQAAAQKEKGNTPYIAPCDRCFGARRGAAALAAYRLLRVSLGGP